MPKNRKYFSTLEKYWFRGDARIFFIALGKGGHYAKLIYNYLAAIKEDIDPSEEKMALHLDVSPNTVRKYLKILTSQNIIKLHKGRPVYGQKARNIYEFVPYAQWKVTSNIAQAFKSLTANQDSAEQIVTNSDEPALVTSPHQEQWSRLNTCGGATAPDAETPPHGVRNNKRTKVNELNECNQASNHSSFSIEEEPKKDTSSTLGLIDSLNNEIIKSDMIFPKNKSYRELVADGKILFENLVSDLDHILWGNTFLEDYPKAIEDVFGKGGWYFAHRGFHGDVIYGRVASRFKDTQNPKFKSNGPLHNALKSKLRPILDRFNKRLDKKTKEFYFSRIAVTLPSWLTDICDLAEHLGLLSVLAESLSNESRGLFGTIKSNRRFLYSEDLFDYLATPFLSDGLWLEKSHFWYTTMIPLMDELDDKFLEKIEKDYPHLIGPKWNALAGCSYFFGIKNTYMDWQEELRKQDPNRHPDEFYPEEPRGDLAGFHRHLQTISGASVSGASETRKKLFLEHIHWIEGQLRDAG